MSRPLLVTEWDHELYRLPDELRDTPDYRDGLQAIIDAWERWPLTLFERTQEREARPRRVIHRILRESAREAS